MLGERAVDAGEAVAVHPGVEESAVQQRQLGLRAGGDVDRERINVQVVLRLELDGNVRELRGKLVQRPVHSRAASAGRVVVGQSDNRTRTLGHRLDLDDLLDDLLDDPLDNPGDDLLDLDRHFLGDDLRDDFFYRDFPFDDLLDRDFLFNDLLDRDDLRLAAGRQRYRTGNPQGGAAPQTKHLSACNHGVRPLPPGQPPSNKATARMGCGLRDRTSQMSSGCLTTSRASE